MRRGLPEIFGRARQLHSQHFFGKYPALLDMVNHLTDDQIRKLLRGGHDPKKVYAAYKAAVDHTGSPTVILAKTVKGYGLGEAGEGRNVTHQQKKLNERELREFRSRFDIPLADEEVVETPFYRPPLDSPETQYVLGTKKPTRRIHPRAQSQDGGAESSRRCLLQRVPQRFRSTCLVDDHGHGAFAHQASASRGNRQTDRPDYPR